MAEDIKRARYVVKHFQDLQGLRLIPFAIFFLIGAYYDASLNLESLTQHPRLALIFVMPTVLIISILASRKIGQWYERRYGYVETRGMNAFRPVAWHIVFGCGFLVGLHNGLLLLLGLYLWSKARPSRHIPSAAVFLALAVNWPGVDTGVQAIPANMGLNHYAVLDLILAAVLAGVGLYNHRLLRRHLKPVPREEATHEHTL